MFRMSVLFLLLFTSFGSFAAQRIQVKDGDQVKVVISSQDVSRLAVEGEGRLKRVWSPKGYLDLKPDKAQGEAFFKAVQGAPRTFSFFARDDFGNTFTIIATQDAVPSQTIMLVPQNQQKVGVNDEKRKTLPYKKAVNDLFKAMFLEQKLPGYTVSDQDEDVPVWVETKIRLIKTYRSHKFMGDVYEITNLSKGSLEFRESEFFDFGEHVLAAGLEHLTIGANQKTKLYVVRRANGENG
jgi:conjugal transfer pilus assembly protein TraK